MVVASADFLSDTGKLRLIRSDGTVTSSPQSGDGRYGTIDTYNSLLASVVSLQAQVAAMSFSLASTQANMLQVQDPNGVYQPCSKLSFDSGSISTMHTRATGSHHAWVGSVSPPLDPP